MSLGMTIDINKLKRLADITIECEPEHVPIGGNASAIDEETDRENEAAIREQLRAGNAWAWCTVVVRAEYLGIEGTDVLGCCSYASEADFKQGGYYDDMVRHALNELAEKLALAAEALPRLEKDPDDDPCPVCLGREEGNTCCPPEGES